MKKILFLFVCFLFVFTAHAQTADRKWNIGMNGGLTQYDGDLGYGFYSTNQSNQASYAFAGISLSRYLSDYWDISVFATKGEVGYIRFLNKGSRESGYHSRFRASMGTGNLVFRFNFTGPKAIVRPFLYAGLGAIMYEAKYDVLKHKNSFSVPSLGGGFRLRLSEMVSLQLQESFMFTDRDDIDGDINHNNEDYLQHTIGLTFNMGKKKDADLDGVSDNNDKCANTPSGVAVNKEGCPLDRDLDGVADYQDECPDKAGIANLQGCPDRDGDGIADQKDRCPEASGVLALKGCPDADADGVADMDDKCPGTKAGYKVDAAGCVLDTDKDGIMNEDDRCPDLAGTAALKGCPDSDVDGVADMDDLCPKVRGTLANKGCPEIAVEDVKRITIIASKIYFETNSAKLKTSSFDQLDALVSILKRYEGTKLTIEGHTDNVGEDNFNIQLSQRRTDSVKEYLISKGILESHLISVGYGETRPVGNNATKLGRTQNRRVELKTAY